MTTNTPIPFFVRSQLARLTMIVGIAAFAGTAGAETFICVSTSAELQQALTDASDGGTYAGTDVSINIVRGTYKTGAATGNGPFSYHSTAATGGLYILGGLKTGCVESVEDATLTVLDGNNTTQVLNIQNAMGDVFVQYLTIQNGESATAGGGVAVNTTTSGGRVYLYYDIIQNNHTASIGGGFSIDSAGDQMAVANSLVVGNAADGNYGAGFEYSRSSEEGILQSNTVYKNTTTASGGTGGVYCCGPGSQAYISANILWQNTNYGLFLEGSLISVNYNDYGATNGMPGSGTLNFDTDPKFVNAADGDYRLAADSTLIGAYPLSAGELLSVDLAGDAYPFSGFADIGAYEDTVFKDGFEGE